MSKERDENPESTEPEEHFAWWKEWEEELERAEAEITSSPALQLALFILIPFGTLLVLFWIVMLLSLWVD